MRPEAIRSHLRKQPFHPIRVYVSDGSYYDVRHPELMLISRIEIAIALDPGNDKVPERFIYCDPVHITRIEPFNGKKPRRTRKKRAT